MQEVFAKNRGSSNGIMLFIRNLHLKLDKLGSKLSLWYYLTIKFKQFSIISYLIIT